MNRLFVFGLVVFCMSFQTKSFAADDAHACGCKTLRVFVPVSGAKQPWQLCVRNNHLKECSWLEAGDTRALFVSCMPSKSSSENDNAETQPFMTVFVQNHPEGQACIVDDPEGGNVSVTCYDIVKE